MRLFCSTSQQMLRDSPEGHPVPGPKMLRDSSEGHPVPGPKMNGSDCEISTSMVNRKFHAIFYFMNFLTSLRFGTASSKHTSFSSWFFFSLCFPMYDSVVQCVSMG